MDGKVLFCDSAAVGTLDAPQGGTPTISKKFRAMLAGRTAPHRIRNGRAIERDVSGVRMLRDPWAKNNRAAMRPKTVSARVAHRNPTICAAVSQIRGGISANKFFWGGAERLTAGR